MSQLRKMNYEGEIVQGGKLHIETKDHAGHVVTNIPSPYLPRLSAAFGWFESELSLIEQGHVPRAETVTLKWTRESAAGRVEVSQTHQAGDAK